MTDSNPSTVTALQELEHKIAELEHAQAVTDKELFLANNKIAMVENRLAILINSIKELRTDSDSGAVPVDRPPHY